MVRRKAICFQQPTYETIIAKLCQFPVAGPFIFEFGGVIIGLGLEVGFSQSRLILGVDLVEG